MGTSGSTLFNLNVLEIAEEAWERASGGATELRSGYDLRTVRRSLNLLLLEWANQGLNLWTLEEGSLALEEGQEHYLLPEDTVDIMEQRIEYGPPDNRMSLSIPRTSISNYSTRQNLRIKGRPNLVTVDRQAKAPIARVWPIPDSDEYSLLYWRIRRIQDAGTGVEVQDVPFRFLPALVSGLAYKLATKIPEGASRISLLKMQYDEAWTLASDEDRDKSPVRLVPRISRW